MHADPLNTDIEFLENLLGRRVSDLTPVGGGSICRVFRIRSGRDSWCLKRLAGIPVAGIPVDLFAAEQAGLEALAAGGEVRVPRVVHCDPQRLVLEWLPPGPPDPDDAAALGHQLAALHDREVEQFGYSRDNYCGLSPQDNTPCDDGYRFFARHRLHPQAERAHAAGLLTGNDRKRLESIADNLSRWIPAQPPSLIHGDLWSGNIHYSTEGPALIDPAAHHGWAEAELAMTRLFGAQNATFYSAYHEARPIEPGFEERVPLYNLYHLLNHLNLFGAGWLAGVRSVLERFA